VAYLGSPEAAVPPLEALVAAGYEVPIVVTQPDRRRGRGGDTSPTPVKAAAEQLGLPVSHDPADAAAVDADLGVVVAFGRILRADLLAALPMVNLHFSLLPRWRGAAPVERALRAGDDRTGVCLMVVDEALDTGAVYARVETPIGPDDTADSLRERLVQLGTDLLVEQLAVGLGVPEPQEGEPTYAAKITADDLELEWTHAAGELDRLVRVGGAWTTFRGKRLKVWEAHVESGGAGDPGTVDAHGGVSCGVDRLVLDVVQPEGKARQAAADWVNGARIDSGEALGAPLGGGGS
jgi:methionyl-tRNA formyltransferase